MPTLFQARFSEEFISLMKFISHGYPCLFHLELIHTVYDLWTTLVKIWMPIEYVSQANFMYIYKIDRYKSQCQNRNDKPTKSINKI